MKTAKQTWQETNRLVRKYIKSNLSTPMLYDQLVKEGHYWRNAQDCIRLALHNS